MTGHIIHIFNRAPTTLVVMKDGKTTDIPPGHSHITADLFEYARTQHPMPGSEDPLTTQFESFISYVADPSKQEKQKDSLEPVPQEIIDLLPKERLNRMMLTPDRRDGTVEANRFPTGRVGVEHPTTGMIDPGRFGGGEG